MHITLFIKKKRTRVLIQPEERLRRGSHPQNEREEQQQAHTTTQSATRPQTTSYLGAKRREMRVKPARAHSLASSKMMGASASVQLAGGQPSRVSDGSAHSKVITRLARPRYQSSSDEVGFLAWSHHTAIGDSSVGERESRPRSEAHGTKFPYCRHTR